MSDLQIGLIVLGLALILIVMLFNWWQDWRARVRMRDQFSSQDDALFADASSGQRREPMLSGNLIETAAADDEVDPQCEAVIDISFAQPVAAQPLAEALQSLVRTTGKSIRVFVQRDGGAERTRLALDEPCVALHLAVLLANRSGPLSAIAWSNIWTQAQALATQFDGVIEGPEQDQVLHQAAQLDALCARLDATVNLQLKLSDTPLSDTVQRLAREIGFVPYGEHLVWMNAHARPEFTLLANGMAAQTLAANHRVERLDLTMDVPNSPVNDQAFSRMAGVGRDLARRLHAVLLDDQGKPLATDADAAVDAQLTEIARHLREAGFTPGDARCARVFA